MSETEPRIFSAFEELFFLRDHPDAPSSFFVKFEIDGILDQQLAQSALDEVCKLHPLACCKVQREPKRRPCWVFCSQPISINWCEQEFTQAGFPTSYFDPTQQRPLRVTCFPAGDCGATMLFHVHHVAFDGLGFLQLFQDWMSIYHGRKATIRTYDQQKLSGRCRPSISFGKALRLLTGQWKSVRATYHVLGRKVISFLPEKDQAVAVGETSPRVVSRTLSLEVTEALRKFARLNGVSTNSVLARDLYISLNQWQRENEVQPLGSHYRLVMPFNERRQEHEAMSACNHCTIINFDRSPEEISNPESLLAGIDDEVRTIQRWRLSLNFWRALNYFRWLPGGLAKHASPHRVTATTLFSNLGPLDRHPGMFSSDAGDAFNVTDIEVAPTLHRGMAIAIVAYEFHGRIRITMQYDGSDFSESQASEFLDKFLALLTASGDSQEVNSTRQTRS